MNKDFYDKIPAYELVREEDLPDIHAAGVQLIHKKSGARVILLPCADDNKVFNIVFRTPPADSTGVAHIIEHTVLCGSEHFPLKDPFVELAKGSLNTFLNAMTYPDKTMYPVASTNDADFRNLMHVYLDAVFHPNIYHEQNIFRQEGWHYELTDPAGPLTISGVVYSEMKGAFSSADEVLERETMNALFPDTSYGVESGGDPAVIPDLTYEAYLDFHRRYYHPSNSYIFLYGDLDMAEALAFIDRDYLSAYDRIGIDSTIKRQEPFAEERVVVGTYPVTPDEDEADKTHLTWNAVCGDPLNVKEKIAFEVLDYALFSAPGAPVRQALIDAGIGMDVYGQYADGILQPYFSVTAKNANAKDADRFRAIILDTLQAEADRGISRKSLEAGLNSLEFQFREADFSSFPKGLFYTISIMDSWLYDEDHPFVQMKQLAAFAELRAAIDEGYFEDLLRRSILENAHRALVILKPEKGLQEMRDAALADKLEAMRVSFSEEERQRIMGETAALLAWQDEEETPEALSSIPVLERKDIRREIADFPNREDSAPVRGESGEETRVPVLFHRADSNGISYLEALFDAQHLKEEEIPWLALLKAVLFNLDTDGHNYRELSNEINAETGGIGASLLISEDPGGKDAYRAFLVLRGKALYARTDKMIALMREVLLTSHFGDKKRMREMISQILTQMQMTFMQAGHSLAGMRAEASFIPQAAFGDLTGGIAFYRFMKDLDAHFEERCGEITDHLAAVARKVATLKGLMVSVTCEEAEEVHFQNVLAAGLSNFPDGEMQDDRFLVSPYGGTNEGFTTSGQVQYVAYAGDWRGRGRTLNGAMTVYRSLMGYEYLWQNVRVRGNAYGCASTFKRCGSAVMTSYRDPHLKRTLDTYRGIPDYLEAFAPDEQEMTKYVIGTMGGVDTPLTPSLLGMMALRTYLAGQTDQERQERRDEILAASAEDMRALAPAVRAALASGSLCVIGSEAMIEKHRDLFDHVEQLL